MTIQDNNCYGLKRLKIQKLLLHRNTLLDDIKKGRKRNSCIKKKLVFLCSQKDFKKKLKFPTNYNNDIEFTVPCVTEDV